MLGALPACWSHPIGTDGSTGDDSATDGGLALSWACPPELSFQAVGKPFLETYCARCHAPTRARELGASHVIDTEARVREHGMGLYDLVLSGAMPRAGGPVPEADKRDFLDWLECSGASSAGQDHSH